MDHQDKIPSGKAQRAGRFFKTGMKVGGNYLKHYSRKALSQDADRSDLDRQNADDIFRMLTQLKGTALKIAQMISLDQGILPREYAERFKESQYSNQPLSGPLIVNTFKKYNGVSPYDLFDRFDTTSVKAASIGQVHQAWKDGVKLAVKIQYPGVADSIHSDINMVKPLFLRAFNLKPEDIEPYLEELVDKLIEETDYTRELEHATSLAEACSGLDFTVFPKYYPELSNQKVLVMEWLDGVPLTEMLNDGFPQEKKDRVGQMLLDFMHFQLHTLKRFHADPHPGNFLLMEDGRLGVLDFGCVKALSEAFYVDYFSMIKACIEGDEAEIRRRMLRLDYLRPGDSAQLEGLFYDTVRQSIERISRPLEHESFYFGDKAFYEELKKYGLSLAGNKKFRQSDAIRGPKDAIYLHRTFFGVYNVLHELRATVRMDKSFFEPLG